MSLSPLLPHCSLFSLGKVVQHRRHKALGYSRTRQH
ncbi:hypothetical protein EIO60_02818|nr:hypothetical protein [Candidatus Pantoea persica]